MITGIHHVAYVVKNMEASIHFLEKSMGLKLQHRKTLTEFEMAVFKVGESRIELIRPIQADSQYTEFLNKTGGGLNHVAFATDNLENDSQKGKEAGVGYEELFVAETSWRITDVDKNNIFGMRLQLAEKGTGI